MAGNSSSSPAWSQASAAPAGQRGSAAALTGSSRAGRRGGSRRGGPAEAVPACEDLPHRLRGDRHARRGSAAAISLMLCPPRAARAPAPAVRRWPCAAPSGRAWTGEQGDLPGAQQGGHLVHRGGSTEPVGDLGGGGLVDEVGAQGLVAALPGPPGAMKNSAPRPQLVSLNDMHL